MTDDRFLRAELHAARDRAADLAVVLDKAGHLAELHEHDPIVWGLTQHAVMGLASTTEMIAAALARLDRSR